MTGIVGAPSGATRATSIPEAPRSLWSDAWSTLRQNRAAMAAVILLGVLVLLVLFGPYLTGWRFDKPNWDEIRKWLAYLEQESINRNTHLKAYFVYGNAHSYSEAARRKELCHSS